eukprot:6017901-Pyramimonas_sp.AAC.1
MCARRPRTAPAPAKSAFEWDGPFAERGIFRNIPRTRPTGERMTGIFCARGRRLLRNPQAEFLDSRIFLEGIFRARRCGIAEPNSAEPVTRLSSPVGKCRQIVKANLNMICRGNTMAWPRGPRPQVLVVVFAPRPPAFRGRVFFFLTKVCECDQVALQPDNLP